MTQNTQFRKIFVTINNDTEDDQELIKLALVKFDYIAIGKHVGEKSNLPHIHIICKLKTQMRFTAVKKIFPRGDIQALKGTWLQAYDYLNKEKTLGQMGNYH